MKKDNLHKVSDRSEELNKFAESVKTFCDCRNTIANIIDDFGSNIGSHIILENLDDEISFLIEKYNSESKEFLKLFY